MATKQERKMQLAVGVDATEAKQGFAEVKAAGANAAEGIAQAGKKAAAGVDAIGTSAETAAAAMNRNERSIIGSIERATAALKAGGKAGSDYYEALAKERGISGDAIAPYIAKLREAEAAQKAATAASREAAAVNTVAAASLDKTGMSAKAVSAALRGVPAQFTDIFVSLQGGQAPITVLLQQGGQLKDMFGGIGPAARALGGYVVGLINPFTLAAAAAGLLTYAYYENAQQSKEFTRGIVLSGNAAGVTTDQMVAMAQRIGKGGAANALAELAAGGEVAGTSLERFAKLGLTLESSVGIPVKQTVKNFEDLGRTPVEASLRLTEQYRYLTAEVYNQIKALQDQGNMADAARVAQDAYASAMEARSSRVTQSLGALERGWNAIASAAKSAWNAMLSVDRPTTLTDELARAQSDLQARIQRGPLNDTPAMVASFEKGNEGLRQRIAFMSETVRMTTRAAEQEAALNRQREAGVKWLQDGEKFQSKQAKLTEEIERARALGKAAGQTDDQINKRVADITANSKNKATPIAGLDEAARREALGKIQSVMREELAATEAQSRSLELVRQAGGLSDASYYAQKAALIQKANGIEEDAYRQQLKRLDAEHAKGTAAINVRRQADEIRAKLVAREIEGQSKLDAVNQQADVAAKKREATLKSLTTTHERYIESLQLRADREVAAIGMGDRERQFASGRDAISDKYLQQERALQDQRMFAMAGNQWNPDDEVAYAKRLANLQTEKTAEVEIYEQTYARISNAQTRWELGASSAFANYLESARNVAGQTNSLFTKVYSGLEDAAVGFVMRTGTNFKSLANSIVADLLRIELRRAATGIFGGGGVGGLLGSVGSFLGSLLPNAKGNAYSSPDLSRYSGTVVNQPTVFAFAKGAGVMGEAGAEAILPLKRGADGKLGVQAQATAAGDTVFHMPIDARGADAGVAARIEEGVQRAVRLAMASVQSEASRGGSFARAVGRRR